MQMHQCVAGVCYGHGMSRSSCDAYVCTPILLIRGRLSLLFVLLRFVVRLHG